MRRISAIFIAACVVLIAASAGAVLYLGFGVDASTSAIVALAALTAMALFNSGAMVCATAPILATRSRICRAVRPISPVRWRKFPAV